MGMIPITRGLWLACAVILGALCLAETAKGGLVIDGTFGSSITSLPDAAAVEAGIDQAISQLEAAIANPITVNIVFEDMSTGLGMSDTYYNSLPYSQYLTDLKNNQTLSNEDKIALTNLPSQTDNPANGNADVNLTLPLLRAIGETSLGDNAVSGGTDSVISLNLADMNVSRTGTQNADDYDLQAVALHEMDEAMGIGGSGSELSSTDYATGPVRPMDLFRYGAAGVRSYSMSPDVTSYFSIDGGATDLVHFNQSPDGDFGDWGDGSNPAQDIGNTPPQVQDAFGDPGVDVNLGTNELIALDVVGYNLTEAVPEPGEDWLAAGGLLAVALTRRRMSMGGGQAEGFTQRRNG